MLIRGIMDEDVVIGWFRSGCDVLDDWATLVEGRASVLADI
jgi:hypothetical protein